MAHRIKDKFNKRTNTETNWAENYAGIQKDSNPRGTSVLGGSIKQFQPYLFQICDYLQVTENTVTELICFKNVHMVKN